MIRYMAILSLCWQPLPTVPLHTGGRKSCRIFPPGQPATLPPAATDPDIAVAAMRPMALYPHGVRTRSGSPNAGHPYPTAVPAPVTRHPVELRSRRDGDDFNLRRWRGLGDHHRRRWRRGTGRRRSCGRGGSDGLHGHRRGLIYRYVNDPSLSATGHEQNDRCRTYGERQGARSQRIDSFHAHYDARAGLWVQKNGIRSAARCVSLSRCS